MDYISSRVRKFSLFVDLAVLFGIFFIYEWFANLLKGTPVFFISISSFYRMMLFFCVSWMNFARYSSRISTGVVGEVILCPRVSACAIHFFPFVLFTPNNGILSSLFIGRFFVVGFICLVVVHILVSFFLNITGRVGPVEPCRTLFAPAVWGLSSTVECETGG